MESEKFVKASDVKEYFKRAILGADQKVDKWVDAIPAADVRPVVRGEWTKRTIALPLSDSCKTAYKCSNCSTHWDYTSPFCPFCGADMEEEEQNA